MRPSKLPIFARLDGKSSQADKCSIHNSTWPQRLRWLFRGRNSPNVADNTDDMAGKHVYTYIDGLNCVRGGTAINASFISARTTTRDEENDMLYSRGHYRKYDRHNTSTNNPLFRYTSVNLYHERLSATAHQLFVLPGPFTTIALALTLILTRRPLLMPWGDACFLNTVHFWKQDTIYIALV